MARVAKKKISFGTSMGVSSIIAILVVLVLVVFATLSIATSKADLTLALKTADSVRAFYDADAVAEDRMFEVSEAIGGGDEWQAELLQKDFSVSPNGDDGALVAYTVPIDDNRNLNVELLIDGEGNMARNLWQVVPAKEYVADNSINLVMPD
jgi:hypothetical protein